VNPVRAEVTVQREHLVQAQPLCGCHHRRAEKTVHATGSWGRHSGLPAGGLRTRRTMTPLPDNHVYLVGRRPTEREYSIVSLGRYLQLFDYTCPAQLPSLPDNSADAEPGIKVADAGRVTVANHGAAAAHGVGPAPAPDHAMRTAGRARRVVQR
jgi:hypothetical protein